MELTGLLKHSSEFKSKHDDKKSTTFSSSFNSLCLVSNDGDVLRKIEIEYIFISS